MKLYAFQISLYCTIKHCLKYENLTKSFQKLLEVMNAERRTIQWCTNSTQRVNF